MDPNQDSRKPPETFLNPAFSADYEGPPPSYSESTLCSPLTVFPPAVHKSSRISTTPMYSEDFLPPYSVLPPNAAYVCTPYPTLQLETAVNGFPGSDVITSEPSWTPIAPPKPKDYMCFSILSLFLCFPLGVVALVYSFNTRSAVQRGDLDTAAMMSHKALILNRISRFGILIIITLVFIFIFYFVRTKVSSENYGAG
ncbi:transmembrane protein PMIS2 [Eleutherodactylus coqui]|uniref:transmembrane protein PMIS2 n=1 Tax=Eleutherodactylus coqui TaxID=57060 RepID=UPI0034636ED0